MWPEPSGCAWDWAGPGKMEAPADVRSAWWPCTAHDSERRCGSLWMHRMHRIRVAGNNMKSTCNSEMALGFNKVAKDEEIYYGNMIYIYIYDEEFVVWGVLNFRIQLLFVDQCMFSMSSLHISKRGCCMFLPIWHNLTDSIHVVLPNSRPFFWESFLNTPYIALYIGVTGAVFYGKRWPWLCHVCEVPRRRDSATSGCAQAQS